MLRVFPNWASSLVLNRRASGRVRERTELRTCSLPMQKTLCGLAALGQCKDCFLGSPPREKKKEEEQEEEKNR